jgi:hypothetical protein
MEGWQIALLVLAAVFVGMWIPVSLQLFATLRSSRRVLESMGSRGEQTLGEASTTLAALDRTLTDASATMGTLNQTLADVGEIAHEAARIKDSIHLISSIAAAVGPAVIALVRALREPEAEAGDPGGNGASARTESPAPTQEEATP